MWTIVSNNLPSQIFEEYPKNWTNNRIAQNIASPKQIRLPKLVCISSFAEVKQRSPIRRSTSAIKNVCAYINCRLIVVKEPNSCFQLNCFGNEACTSAKIINKMPMILIWNSIYKKLRVAIKHRHEWREFGFLKSRKAGTCKSIFPGVTGEKMGKAYCECQEIRKVPQMFYHNYFPLRFTNSVAFF